MASRLGQSCAKMVQSMPWIGARQRDWPIFGWFRAERTKHLHYDEKDIVVRTRNFNVSRFLKIRKIRKFLLHKYFVKKLG